MCFPPPTQGDYELLCEPPFPSVQCIQKSWSSSSPAKLGLFTLLETGKWVWNKTVFSNKKKKTKTNIIIGNSWPRRMQQCCNVDHLYRDDAFRGLQHAVCSALNYAENMGREFSLFYWFSWFRLGKGCCRELLDFFSVTCCVCVCFCRSTQFLFFFSLLLLFLITFKKFCQDWAILLDFFSFLIWITLFVY